MGKLSFQVVFTVGVEAGVVFRVSLEGVISLDRFGDFGREFLVVSVFVGAVGRDESWLSLWVSVRGSLAFFGLGLGSWLLHRFGA